MTTIAADEARDVPAAPAASCFHCGDPVRSGASWNAIVRGVDRAFCCAGCLAISETIDAAGLETFYARRRAAARPQALDADDAWTGSDDDAVRAGLARRRHDGRLEAALLLEGLTCGACVWLVESWLMRQPGVARASVNYATRRASVEWRGDKATLAGLVAAIARIGYPAHPYDPARREALMRRERRSLLARMAIALLAMMQVMMFAVPGYVGSDEVSAGQQALLDWASLVITLPALLYSAAPLFRGAWRDLSQRRLGMDVPVVLGLSAAFAASAWSTLGHGGPVYYDSVTMFIALLLVARHAELVARQRAQDAIERVARHRAERAERLADWPASLASETVAAASLAVGVHVLVRPGATIPADGVVVDGCSHVDEAVLTGESRPRAATRGDRVIEGAINHDGPLVVRVTAAGDATRLAAVLRLVDQAAAERPQLARIADRVAQWFVASLVVLALAVGAAWLAIDPSRALPVVFALLVVSCPCALSLATPATFAAAAGALSRHDVVIARAGALETLARVTHVVFDKTGTLTEGSFRVVNILPFDGDERGALALAATLEAASEHPIALALRAAAPPAATTAEHVRNVPGSGIEGRIDGRTYRIGSPAFVADIVGALPLAVEQAILGFASTATVVLLARERALIAAFALDDALRVTSARAVEALHALGVTTLMLSGDRLEAAMAAGRALGIASARGGLSPDDKRSIVRSLQDQGAVVAMAGDGINDAPGLAQAQLSLSLASATPLAQWTADVIVLSDDPARIPEAIAHARRTLRLVRQNLGWAFAYNLVAIPAAALGYVTPLLAAAGMSLSSLAVIGNAVRAGRMRARIGGHRWKS